MSLCSRQNVKDLLGLASTDTASDSVIDRLLAGVCDQFARLAGRIVGGVPCLEAPAGAKYEYFSPEPRTRFLFLTARPVVLISSIKEATLGGWDDVVDLVENTDYQLHTSRGKLIRSGWWMAGDMTVRVQYTGGYVFAPAWVSGTSYVPYEYVTYDGIIYKCKQAVSGAITPASDLDHWLAQPSVWAVPEELRDAAAKQTAFYWRRMAKLGIVSEGVQGASIQAYAKDDFLPDVKRIVGRYGRRT